MAEYPVVFTVKEAVSGNGFLAGVTIHGRAIIVNEDDAWWAYGVRPAAIAESDKSFVGSYACFSRALKAYLIDTATTAKDYDAFKVEVERFFEERDEAEEQRWQDARVAIQRGDVAVDPAVAAVKRETDPRPASLYVERLDKPQVFTPLDNVLETFALAEAA